MLPCPYPSGILSLAVIALQIRIFAFTYLLKRCYEYVPRVVVHSAFSVKERCSAVGISPSGPYLHWQMWKRVREYELFA